MGMLTGGLRPPRFSLAGIGDVKKLPAIGGSWSWWARSGPWKSPPGRWKFASRIAVAGVLVAVAAAYGLPVSTVTAHTPSPGTAGGSGSINSPNWNQVTVGGWFQIPAGATGIHTHRTTSASGTKTWTGFLCVTTAGSYSWPTDRFDHHDNFSPSLVQRDASFPAGCGAGKYVAIYGYSDSGTTGSTMTYQWWFTGVNPPTPTATPTATLTPTPSPTPGIACVFREYNGAMADTGSGEGANFRAFPFLVYSPQVQFSIEDVRVASHPDAWVYGYVLFNKSGAQQATISVNGTEYYPAGAGAYKMHFSFAPGTRLTFWGVSGANGPINAAAVRVSNCASEGDSVQPASQPTATPTPEMDPSGSCWSDLSGAWVTCPQPTQQAYHSPTPLPTGTPQPTATGTPPPTATAPPTPTMDPAGPTWTPVPAATATAFVFPTQLPYPTQMPYPTQYPVAAVGPTGGQVIECQGFLDLGDCLYLLFVPARDLGARLDSLGDLLLTRRPLGEAFAAAEAVSSIPQWFNSDQLQLCFLLPVFGEVCVSIDGDEAPWPYMRMVLAVGVWAGVAAHMIDLARQVLRD
jgi:hypothetical protein